MNKHIFYMKDNKLVYVMKDYKVDEVVQFNSCVHESLYDVLLILTNEQMHEYVENNNIIVSGFDENFNKIDII